MNLDAVELRNGMRWFVAVSPGPFFREFGVFRGPPKPLGLRPWKPPRPFSCAAIV
jgi:hypothetical protein